MIEKLEIKNFKSIKDLKLKCKRINVFIGEPNTGKSNILESLGFLSFLSYNGNLKDYVRLRNMANLFYDMDLSNEVSVALNDKIIILRYEYDSNFRVYLNGGPVATINMQASSWEFKSRQQLPFKFYRFKTLSKFGREEPSFLYPPNGDNLATILLTNKKMRIWVNDLLRKFNLKMIVKLIEKEIEVQKELDGIIISLPYHLLSDTLQRIIFYFAAIETNRDSILIFEEPEANAFPFYTKYLAERIAKDDSNQYFISTHNPYMLLSILSKTPIDDIQIFITYFEDNQTKVKTLSNNEKSEVLDLDASVFFDIDRFLEG